MSRVLTTVEERMLSEAEFGFFHLYTKITKKKAKELQEKGFIVTDSKEKNSYPRLHKISWVRAAVEGDIQNLDENDEKYSLPERLWIISKKNIVN